MDALHSKYNRKSNECSFHAFFSLTMQFDIGILTKLAI